MSEGTPGVCLRCGDFLAPGARAVEGLELCRPCFRPREVLVDPVVNVPPAGVMVGLVALALAVAFLGALAGAVVGLRHGLEPDDGAAIGAILVLLLALNPWFLAAADRFQDRGWKRATVEALGFAATPLEQLAFVYYTARPSDLVLRSGHDVGLLAETPAAAVIFGRRGERAVVELRDVTRVALERKRLVVAWWPLAVCLELSDGARAWVSVRSTTTFAANRRMTRELHARLRAKIDAARRPPAT